MDTELARTFLTVIEAGNFSNAASKLFITQSTVSARIATLEEQLGCSLFIRNKDGATLTPAGRWFQRPASTLVRTVARARHEIGLAKTFRTALTVGGRFGLWEEFLLQWLPAMRAAAPDVSLHAEVGFEDDLMQGLVEGRLDLGVMYTPQSRPGLVVERLLEERLVLVSTESAASTAVQNHGYVYVDWGEEFHTKHNMHFPDFDGSALSVNIGWLGFRHVLANGGAGYFPHRLVRDQVGSGALHLVDDAPQFEISAYAVYPGDSGNAALPTALQTIRHVARTTDDVADCRRSDLDQDGVCTIEGTCT